jgi:hypothetical protein
LDSRSIDDIIHNGISEGRVESSGGIDSSNTVTSDSGDGGEGSGEDEFTCCIERCGPYRVVREVHSRHVSERKRRCSTREKLDLSS